MKFLLSILLFVLSVSFASSQLIDGDGGLTPDTGNNGNNNGTRGQYNCPGLPCDYYAQIAAASGCLSQTHYPLGYGIKYCRRFTELMNSPSSSPALQCWICGTRQCLLDNFKDSFANAAFTEGCLSEYIAWEQDPTNPTKQAALQSCMRARGPANHEQMCQRLYDEAVESHGKCYRFAGSYHSGCDLTCLDVKDLINIPFVPDVKDICSPEGVFQICETGIGAIMDYCNNFWGGNGKTPKSVQNKFSLQSLPGDSSDEAAVCSAIAYEISVLRDSLPPFQPLCANSDVLGSDVDNLITGSPNAGFATYPSMFIMAISIIFSIFLLN